MAEKLREVLGCKICGGNRWVTAHHPNCDGSCKLCPIQEECKDCYGTGFNLTIDIDQATTKIKSLLKSKLPKRKTFIEFLGHNYCDSEIQNQCLTEIEKIVEEL